MPDQDPDATRLIDPMLRRPLRSYAVLALSQEDLDNLATLAEHSASTKNRASLIRRLVAREAKRLRGEHA